MLLAVCTVAGCGSKSTSKHPGGGFISNGSGYPNADAVLGKLEAAGWPVGEGRPSSPTFKNLTGKTRCASSKTFVRTDNAKTGWGFICVGMPTDLYTQINKTFSHTLMILGPLYLDSGSKLVVFGFGWPGDSSKKFAATLGTTGTYLLPASG
jgi:hypothetical protein